MINQSVRGALNFANRVSNVVSALGSEAQAVPEAAPQYTGGSAAHLGNSGPQYVPPMQSPIPPILPNNPGVFPMQAASPFYVPPVPVSEDDLLQEAEIRATFLLRRLRFGSSIIRNGIAGFLAKANDEEIVQQWYTTQVGKPVSGSQAAKAEKRLEISKRLKDHQSMVTSDESELVGLLKERLYMDLKEQVQRGVFQKMPFDEVMSKMMFSELFGLIETIAEPLVDLGKDALSKK